MQSMIACACLFRNVFVNHNEYSTALNLESQMEIYMKDKVLHQIYHKP